MLLNLQISIQGLIMKIIMVLANVVVIARLFELTVYTLIAPVPLSTFACEGLSDVGKGFLKSYAAVSLQAIVLAIMFVAYSAVNTALVSGRIGRTHLLAFITFNSSVVISSLPIMLLFSDVDGDL